MKNNDALISQFMSIYIKEYDFYHKLASQVSQELEKALNDAGVRAIVSARAKGFESLKNKLHKRNDLSNGFKYKDVSQIYEDIVDLAGVRVALYFPGDMEKVSSIIRSMFSEIGFKEFPNFRDDKEIEGYKKKFDGYHARHFRVKKNDSSRYCNTPVEIQVASVLMHAWSEVEHDLVYKPLSGSLSREELMILDEINGMMISGNIALERLQSAIRDRVNKNHYIFQNHYDLAAYLHQEIDMDDVYNSRELFDFLEKMDLLSKDKLSKVVSGVKDFIESYQRENPSSSIDNSKNYRDGFLNACFIHNVCKLYSEEVINLICGGYIPLGDYKYKMDIATAAFIWSSYKDLAIATTFAEKIIVRSENLSTPGIYDRTKLAIFFEPRGETVTIIQAYTALNEFLDALSGVAEDHFNQESFTELNSLATRVTRFVQERSTDKIV
ncbi:RelA/SpoT domain-containing protein [Atlantibacter hermannii]|uniref:GTP pyrophosphokinase n=1 Tax=Atlantibacter hermannii TaxID=565 RepID=UPI002FDD0712